MKAFKTPADREEAVQIGAGAAMLACIISGERMDPEAMVHNAFVLAEAFVTRCQQRIAALEAGGPPS